jgi:hypothetical protein
MEKLPEFVTNGAEDRTETAAGANLSGWETVVFQLEDEEGSGSDFSTAAIAP